MKKILIMVAFISLVLLSACSEFDSEPRKDDLKIYTECNDKVVCYYANYPGVAAGGMSCFIDEGYLLAKYC